MSFERDIKELITDKLTKEDRVPNQVQIDEEYYAFIQKLYKLITKEE